MHLTGLERLYLNDNRIAEIDAGLVGLTALRTLCTPVVVVAVDVADDIL